MNFLEAVAAELGTFYVVDDEIGLVFDVPIEDGRTVLCRVDCEPGDSDEIDPNLDSDVTAYVAMLISEAESAVYARGHTRGMVDLRRR